MPCLAPNLVVMHLVERETVVCLDESVISRSLVRIRLRRFTILPLFAAQDLERSRVHGSGLEAQE